MLFIRSNVEIGLVYDSFRILVESEKKRYNFETYMARNYTIF